MCQLGCDGRFDGLWWELAGLVGALHVCVCGFGVKWTPEDSLCLSRRAVVDSTGLRWWSCGVIPLVAVASTSRRRGATRSRLQAAVSRTIVPASCPSCLGAVTLGRAEACESF